MLYKGYNIVDRKLLAVKKYTSFETSVHNI